MRGMISNNRLRFFWVISVVLIVVWSLELVPYIAVQYISELFPITDADSFMLHYQVETGLFGTFFYFLWGLIGSAIFASALSASFRELKRIADAAE